MDFITNFNCMRDCCELRMCGVRKLPSGGCGVTWSIAVIRCCCRWGGGVVVGMWCSGGGFHLCVKTLEIRVFGV